MDTPYKGHNRQTLYTIEDRFNGPKWRTSYLKLTIHFEPSKRGQPLYKEQNVWSRYEVLHLGPLNLSVIWSLVPLYCVYSIIER